MLEAIGDHLDQLDDRSTATTADAAFAELHAVKRELLMLRRAIWPLRDALNELRRESTPFITDDTRVYLRDCYDHAVQLIDLLESYRDIAGDVRDFYLSSISNRMNEIMKTLTVIATIFLPLSFIAGVYGMNFNTEVSPWNMPELELAVRLLVRAGADGAVAVGMLLLFQMARLAGRRSEPVDDEHEQEHETMTQARGRRAARQSKKLCNIESEASSEPVADSSPISRRRHAGFITLAVVAGQPRQAYPSAARRARPRAAAIR